MDHQKRYEAWISMRLHPFLSSTLAYQLTWPIFPPSYLLLLSLLYRLYPLIHALFFFFFPPSLPLSRSPLSSLHIVFLLIYTSFFSLPTQSNLISIIKVAVRIRPLLSHELSNGASNVCGPLGDRVCISRKRKRERSVCGERGGRTINVYI